MATNPAATLPRNKVQNLGGRTKYAFVAPTVVVLLLIGLYPVVYSLVASVQNLTMMTQDHSWYGFGWYQKLINDARVPLFNTNNSLVA